MREVQFAIFINILKDLNDTYDVVDIEWKKKKNTSIAGENAWAMLNPPGFSKHDPRPQQTDGGTHNRIWPTSQWKV